MAKPANALSLSDDQRFDWLRLIRSENVGPRTFRALLNNCGGARAALEAAPELARRGGAARTLRVASAEEIERELAAARKLGVRFVALCEPEYPPLLRQIELSPADPCPVRPGRSAAAAGGGDRRLAERLRRGPDIRRPAGARPRRGRLCRGLGAGARDRSARAYRHPGDRRRRRAGWRTRQAVSDRGRAADRAHGRIRRGRVQMPIEWEPRGRDFPDATGSSRAWRWARSLSRRRAARDR